MKIVSPGRLRGILPNHPAIAMVNFSANVIVCSGLAHTKGEGKLSAVFSVLMRVL